MGESAPRVSHPHRNGDFVHAPATPIGRTTGCATSTTRRALISDRLMQVLTVWPRLHRIRASVTDRARRRHVRDRSPPLCEIAPVVASGDERQDANLQRALRTASAVGAERISVELDAVPSELAEAKRRADALACESRPCRITTKLIQELIDEMTGLLDHGPWRRALPASGTVRADRRGPRPAACRGPLSGADRSAMLTGWYQ